MNSKYLIFLPTVLYGLWNLLMKFAAVRLHPVQMGIVQSCTLLALLPLYIWYVSSRVETQFTSAGVVYMVIATLCAAVAAMTFAFVIKTADIGISSAIISTSPVITCILAASFLNEPITLKKVAGIILSVSGVAILGY